MFSKDKTVPAHENAGRKGSIMETGHALWPRVMFTCHLVVDKKKKEKHTRFVVGWYKTLLDKQPDAQAKSRIAVA